RPDGRRRKAVACLVTISEHEPLSRLDIATWPVGRVPIAKVDVYDLSSDPPRPFITNGEAAGGPDLPD
ncbi:MAG TPA: hypothetical protein VFY84_00200, partial [Jiangellales bacterium]|nr:hypothetical protein [Jiangellales bacterium]